MKRRRVLILLSTLETSGVTNVILNICKWIDRERFELFILTLSPEKAFSDIQQVVDENILVQCVDEENRFKIKDSIIKLRRLVQELQPDLIHTHTLRGTFYASLFLRQYKHLSTMHSDLYKNYRDEFGLLKGLFYTLIESTGLALSTQRTVVSKALIKKLWVKRGVSVIQNGIDVTRFYPKQENERLKSRKQLGFTEQHSIFLTVGSLIQRKDPMTLIKAFTEANRKDAILLVLGKGILAENMQQVAQHHPNILFLGQVKNPETYLQIADYFISSSTSEGLPNAALEAIGCGLLPILSDIDAHHEAAELTQVECSFFKVGDVKGLSVLISEAVRKPDVKMQPYSAQTMVKAYENSYESLLLNSSSV